MATDLLGILRPEELDKLRATFDKATFGKIAQDKVSYGKVGDWKLFIAHTVYGFPVRPPPPPTVFNTPGAPSPTPTTLTAGEREAVVVALMAADKDPFVLAGHLWFALMEGLSVEKVADILMTTATYRGMHSFRFSSSVFADVLAVLKRCHDNPELKVANLRGPSADVTAWIGAELDKFPKY